MTRENAELPASPRAVRQVTDSPMGRGPNERPLGLISTLHAERDPDRPALTFEGRTLTREQFETNANRRARMLQDLGVVQGDLVTLALPNGFAHYETTVALWKLGATPNMVSPKLPDEELREIVAVARPRLVVGVEAGRLGAVRTLAADVEPDGAFSGAPLPEVVSPYWKAATSGGSTGRPKIIVDHMPATWDPDATACGQLAGETVINPGPRYHNAPFSTSHYALFAGCHVVDMGRFDAERWLAMVQAYEAGWSYLVPTMMKRILEAPGREAMELPSLGMIYHAGAACPAWLKQAWIDWLGPERIWELYSASEGLGATMIDGVEWLQRPGSVGRAQFGSVFKVLGEDGRELPPGVVGEIYSRPYGGPGSSFHYLGAESKLLGDLESVGDLGWMDEAGYLYIADRRTDMIVSGGANIYPAEVEGALERCEGVACAVVVGLPDADLGLRAHAIVNLQPPLADLAPHEAEARLRLQMAGKLVRYKIPRSFEFVAASLRDEAGKVRRSQLRAERAGGGVAPDASHAA